LPRSKKWIEINLDNPLLNWYVRAYVSKATVRKVMRAYSQTHNKLIALVKKYPLNLSDKIKKIETLQILKDFLDVFNKIKLRCDIDAIKYKEIKIAFYRLCKLTSLSQKEKKHVWQKNIKF